MEPLAAAAATLALGLALATCITPLAIALGLRLGIADVPGGRRKHARVTSRLGALPIFAAFTAAVLLAQTFGVPTSDPNERTRLFGLLAGGALMFVIAVIDDRFQLAPGPQFAAQIAAAGVAMASLIFIERFRNPFTNAEVVLPAAAAAAVTLLWFVGMVNTVNLLDGVDGLAASVSLVAAAVTAAHMWREGQYSVALLPIALIGVLAGFLVFNLPVARIFLGGGALVLGYALACVGIVGGAKVALLLLVMGLPIADVAWQIIDRSRRGQSPVRGDRGHLHTRLADAGWSARRIVAVYVAVCAGFGAVALVAQPPLLKLITLIALGAGVVVALLRLSRRASPA